MSLLIEPTLSNLQHYGIPCIIPIETPAANAEFTYQPDDNEYILPISLKFVFTADANVGTRAIRIEFVNRHDNVILAFVQDQQGIVANDIIYSNFLHGAGKETATRNYRNNVLPYPFIITPEMRLQTSTLSRKAGDQYSSIFLYGLKASEVVLL